MCLIDKKNSMLCLFYLCWHLLLCWAKVLTHEVSPLYLDNFSLYLFQTEQMMHRTGLSRLFRWACSYRRLSKIFHWSQRSKDNIYMLFAGLGPVHMVKNCDRGLENAACGLRQHFQGRSKKFSQGYKSSQWASNSGTRQRCIKGQIFFWSTLW